jgi:glucokinase
MIWNLIADIGGTNARFGAVLDGELQAEFEFRSYLQPIPVFLVTRSNLGLLGAAKYLKRRSMCV